MSEKKTPIKLFIPPEKMQEIKEKYGLDEAGMKDVLAGVRAEHAEKDEEIEPTGSRQRSESSVEGEPEEMNALIHKIGGGEMTMVDYLMFMDAQDRKEERKRARERDERRDAEEQRMTPEKIAEATTKALTDAGLVSSRSKGKDEEVPEYAKKLDEKMSAIDAKLTRDEEDKRLQDAIEKSTGPLKAELEKEREERKRIEERQRKDGEKPAKSGIDEYVDTHDKLVHAGLLKDEGMPAGTPGEVQLAHDTVDQTGKIMTKGMDDIKTTVETVLEFQLEREKQQYKKNAPPLAALSEEEKMKTLEQAAGTAQAPQ